MSELIEQQIKDAQVWREKAYAVWWELVPKWQNACYELQLAEARVLELEKKLMTEKV